jgi:predicted alpha-1,6-mannanase (GH76 family)
VGRWPVDTGIVGFGRSGRPDFSQLKLETSTKMSSFVSFLHEMPAIQHTDSYVNQCPFRMPAGLRGRGKGLCELPYYLRFTPDSYIWLHLPPWTSSGSAELIAWLYIMLCRSFHALFLLSFGAGHISAASQNYTSNPEAAFKTLQMWYDTNTGIWNTTGWWNSANCLTVIGDLAAVDSSVKSQVIAVYTNSIVAAQKYNLGVTKVVTPDFNIQSFYTEAPPGVVRRQENPKGFLNGYYDDEGWWALGWIQAYDITGTAEYLNTAVDIFNDMKNGSTTQCGGGIWWDKKKTYVNAIANELYLSVAAHLANRVTNNKQSYLFIAQSQWNWFQHTGMINSKSLINDGLTSCRNNNGTVWSYNQGVILGALVELNKASPNTSYISTARSIATAAIKALSDSSGVLHDPCEPNCGVDGSQFKGVFMRNLQILQAAVPDNSYLAFIVTNAASIWANDRNSANQLSVDWAGPFVNPANASTQSSALDALVAAAAFQSQLGNGIASG